MMIRLDASHLPRIEARIKSLQADLKADDVYKEEELEKQEFIIQQYDELPWYEKLFKKKPHRHEDPRFPDLVGERFWVNQGIIIHEAQRSIIRERISTLETMKRALENGDYIEVTEKEYNLVTKGGVILGSVSAESGEERHV
jgi:hypothetical protein